MADLSSNSGLAYQGEIRKRTFDVGANLEVFAGQAMISGANGIVNATSGAGADFAGFAYGYVNNLTNSIPHGGAARATEVECVIQGFVELTVANAAAAAFTHDDKGLVVYATDGATFTTDSTGNAVVIGAIEELDDAVGAASGTVLVKFGF